MNGRNDQQLLRDYAARRSEAAFAELVRRHLDFVYSAALRMVRDAHLAEDVAQGVFVALAQNAARLTDRPVLSGWLHRTAQSLAANAVRSEVRRRAREEEAAAMNDLHAAEPDTVWEQIAPQLDAALGELSEADRDALLLRYFERRSAREMAQTMGTSEEAAQKRVSRAIERLREGFAQRGVTIGASGLVGLISAHAVHAAPVGLSASLVAAVVNVPAAAATKLTAIEHGLDLLALAKGKMAILAGVCGLILIGAGLVFQPRKPGPGGGLKLPGGTGAPDVCLGHTHGLVLASDGSLWSWGTNFLGWPVLGLGDIHRQTSLRRMGDENDWIAIASSDTHSLALKSDGSMWAWGANLYGQLGIGWPDRRDRRNTQRRTPTPSAPGNDWKQVAAGGSHSLALKRDGTLWGWGNNWSGQVGIESTAKEVHEVTQVGTGTNWTRIWSCGIQSVGQQSDGSLWFWGSLTGSDKDSHRFLVPTRVAEDTNSGRFYHLLKKQDGSLWALDALDYATIDKTHYTPIAFRRVQLQKDVVAFATSDTSRNPAGVALTRDGEVWTWGQVFGEYTPESPKMRSWARSLGWKTDRFDGKPVMRDEPWLLPVEE